MAACGHLARDATGLRQYRPADCMAPASTVAPVTMGPVAAWPARLLPHIPCRDTGPRQPAATDTPTAPLRAEQLYVVTAALLADGGESFVHHHGPAQIAGSIHGPAARRAPPVACHAPTAHPRQGRGRRRTPSRATAGGGAGAAGSGLPGHTARPRRGIPVAHPGRGPLDRPARHRQARGIPAPAPCPLAAGAHPGLLYDSGPLAAGSPATHREPPHQEAGTGVAPPPRAGLEPGPGGASVGRMAGRRHQGHGCPGPPRGTNHARPPGGYPRGGSTGTAEPAMGSLHVQPGGRAHRRLRPRARAGTRSRSPRSRLHSHDRQGATGGQTLRPPATGPPKGRRQGSEVGSVAGGGAPR